jgi:diguanylate cyclase (GGDEF)-like protein/PAS domain S-box-containing protein
MIDKRILLLIDNNPIHAQFFQEALLAADEGPYEGEIVTTLSQGLERLHKKGIWSIFANLSLPDSQGLDTFTMLLRAAPGVPTLVLCGAEQGGIAIEAMRLGAKDYLLEDHVDTYSFARAVRNMVERRLAEEVLFIEKERASVTLNSIGDAVLSTDISGNVTYLNVVAEQMTGWACQEAQGKPLKEVFQIIDGATREPSTNPMELAIETRKTVGLSANCVLIRRDGTEISIEDSAAPIHDRAGSITGAVIVFHDVGMSRAITEEMARLAQHDGLTDLPNRMLLIDRLNQAIARASRNGSRVAVMYLDLDGFKHINDSLGHAVGDKMLQSVAARLVSCVRNADTVSRLGGDEFVVLLSEISHAADASITARKILAALSSAHIVDDTHLHITLSIGLSAYPDDGHDAQTLIKNADTAMYQAKETGRNNYRFYTKEMNVRAMERQAIEAELCLALERKELVLHYQPKVSLETGEIMGIEALVRWVHPERGLVPPAQFIPIAEDSGLILPIGKWVLTEACRQVKEWMGVGLRVVPVSINVSALEFRSGEFVEGLHRILKETRLDPSYIELELTETVLMQRAESNISVLRALKSIGVSLAVDDFGTGYSSLSYLKKFPIDTLKIDRSFVRDIRSDTCDCAIVRAVITMAKGLKKCVIAEGVETEAQIKFLQSCGCNQAQGFYFSRALAAEYFAKLLEIGKPSFHISLKDHAVPACL